MVRVDQITAADWSPKLGSPGEIVVDLEDIEQCFKIILTTHKGSVPHRPLFGCDAWLWLDKPSNVAIPNIVREAVESLEMWEPRAEILGVIVTIEASHVTVAVEWQPKGSTVRRYKEVRIVNAA